MLAKISSADLVQTNGVGSSCVDVDVFADSGFQFLDAAKRAAPNAFVGEFGEPSLHKVDPGAVGGSEVDMEPWALGEPLADDRSFVGAVVVHDEVDIERGRYPGFDHVQKLAELHRAMAAMQLADEPVGL